MVVDEYILEDEETSDLDDFYNNDEDDDDDDDDPDDFEMPPTPVSQSGGRNSILPSSTGGRGRGSRGGNKNQVPTIFSRRRAMEPVMMSSATPLQLSTASNQLSSLADSRIRAKQTVLIKSASSLSKTQSGAAAAVASEFNSSTSNKRKTHLTCIVCHKDTGLLHAGIPTCLDCERMFGRVYTVS